LQVVRKGRKYTFYPVKRKEERKRKITHARVEQYRSGKPYQRLERRERTAKDQTERVPTVVNSQLNCTPISSNHEPNFHKIFIAILPVSGRRRKKRQDLTLCGYDQIAKSKSQEEFGAMEAMRGIWENGSS